MDTYRMYLRTLQQGLKLDPEETRTVMAEVRGNLEDLAAHLRAQGYAADDAAAEAVRRFDDAGRLARSIRRARRDPPWPLRALAAPLALGALSGAWFGADALATAIVSVSRHTDSLVVDYGLMRRLAGAVFQNPAPAANILGVVTMMAPSLIVLLLAALALWLVATTLMRRVSMRVRGALLILAALVAAAIGGLAALDQPTTDAMRVVTSGRSPMVLALDARAGHVFAVNYNDGSGPGSIDVLDARSGALQRVIPIGMFPHAMVVDERRGRAFVLNEAAHGRQFECCRYARRARDTEGSPRGSVIHAGHRPHDRPRLPRPAEWSLAAPAERFRTICAERPPTNLRRGDRAPCQDDPPRLLPDRHRGR